MKCNVDIRPLKELADIQTGPFGSQLHKEDYVEVGTPIVTVEHLGNRIFTEQNLPKVSDGDRKRLEKYLLLTGDIVFSRVGSVDRCSYVDERHSGWMFSGRCLRIRPSECINPLYLYYYFCLEEVRQFVRNIAVGATMPSINTKLLGEVPVSVPSIQTQRRIAAILSSLDDKIELNNKINTNLELQAQALYRLYFPYDVASELPEEWRVGTVGEIICLHDFKRIPLSSSERAKMKEKRFPYYGAASLMDYVEDYIFDGRYLLLGEDGTVVDEAGYPILQYVWGKFWVNNHAHVLTGKLGFNVESLYMLLRQTSVKSIVTGAVQSKISQSGLRSVAVVIPPEPLLVSFNTRVYSLFKLIRHNVSENIRLAMLRDILLPYLMSGQVEL